MMLYFILKGLRFPILSNLFQIYLNNTCLNFQKMKEKASETHRKKKKDKNKPILEEIENSIMPPICQGLLSMLKRYLPYIFGLLVIIASLIAYRYLAVKTQVRDVLESKNSTSTAPETEKKDTKDNNTKSTQEMLILIQEKHLSLLDAVNKNPNDADSLYKLMHLTYTLNEYEEAYELGEKLLKIIPDNERFKDTLMKLKRQDQDNKEQAKKMEEDYFSGNIPTYSGTKLKGIYVWSQINQISTELVTYHREKLNDFRIRLDELKKSNDAGIFFEKIKRLCGIETGQIEGIYDVSKNSKRALVLYGIEPSILIVDDTDEFLTNLTGEAKKIRAETMAKIIQDNVNVLEDLEKFVRLKQDISIELIKDLHLLFTRNARYIYNPRAQMKYDLIRRGKWKLFVNEVYSTDYTDPSWVTNRQTVVQIFSPPSKVEENLREMIRLYIEYKNAGVSSEVLAAWVHVAFIYLHPFEDGNGRVARALSSLILLQDNLLPFNVSPELKPSYIQALQIACDGDISLFVRFIESQQYTLLTPVEEGIQSKYKRPPARIFKTPLLQI